MLWNEGKLRQPDVDWRWDRSKTGEKLTLTHVPTGKKVTSEEVKLGRSVDKLYAQKKKRQVYEDLFDKLEEVVYGPQPKRVGING